MVYKVQVEKVSHLQELRQQLRQDQVTTRTVIQSPGELLQPICRTRHQQRQFTHKFIRLWNTLIASDINLDEKNSAVFHKDSE